ncbi:conserved hypothetical protein [Vibrio phage 424E50-1]|nr:conserved hypothetical protein [Vibrio phage 424E50-1]
MLSKEQKWMNRLKKCLSEIPEGCELVVDSTTHNSSTVSLLKEGGFSRSLDANGGDCTGICLEEETILSGVWIHNLIANSESY